MLLNEEIILLAKFVDNSSNLKSFNSY